MKQRYQQLIEALRNGDSKLCVELVSKLLNDGEEKEDIIIKGIQPAMDLMDSKCTSEQFNLLELMLTGRAVMSVVKVVYPDGQSITPNRETVVLAALEGDVHDLGKGVVKMVLGAKGFHTIDCGKDASVENVVQTAIDENASAICISGLISTVIPQVSKVKNRLLENGRGDIFVLAGGAALAQCSKADLNVDFIGGSAFDALNFLQEKFGDK
jgi:methylmalonyl-CoA mutase cobalamin-binding domain/chain